MSVSLRRALAFVLVCSAAIVVPSTHHPVSAAGTPDIDVASTLPGSVLVGAEIPVTITISNASGDDGYNLLVRDVLPAGVSYVPGSSQPAPTQIPQGDGTTVLVWSNIADILDGTTVTVDYRVATSGAYVAGSTVGNDASAYANSNARFEPRVDGDGDPIVSSYTGSDAGSSTTELVPFTITKDEASPEDEFLRGVHDHQVVYTLTVDNNPTGPTTGFNVVDYLPAQLEFLGCGGVDNSTPGTEEYPGAGRIDDDPGPALPNGPCVAPSSVTTVDLDPDGTGPMPSGVYTRVEWEADEIAPVRGSADLAAGGSFQIDYVAAIPLRENVFPGPALPTANLDNNTGPLTSEDEGELANYAVAQGTYDGTGWTDDDRDVFVAEDLRIVKGVSDSTFVQGDAVDYTLDVATSEYALATGPITVTDTLPTAVDYVGATPAPTTGPILNGDGTLTLTWVFPAEADPSADLTITINTVVRTTYRTGGGGDGTPVAARDSFVNTTDVSADVTTMTDNDGSSTVFPLGDVSSAESGSTGLTILKEVSEPAASLTCGTGTGVTFVPGQAGPYRPGDRVCFRLTTSYPAGLTTLDSEIRDFLPAGFELDTSAAGGGWTLGTANTVPAGDIGFTDDSPVLEWDIAEVDPGGVFQVVVQTVVVDPLAAAPGDILDNLMKMTYRNTGDQVFQLRDAAMAEWAEPAVALDKGIMELNGSPVAGAPADGIEVEAEDEVLFRVRVANTGTATANDISVRDVLPDGITCDDVSLISDGGACDIADDWIQWDTDDDIDLAPSGSVDLTYLVTVPPGIAPGETLVNTAGVRTFTGDTNNPDPFVYVPGDNIDPTLTPNTDPADDTSSIITAVPTVDKTRTTSITEADNAAANEATIGETISYSVVVDLPAGLTYYAAVVNDQLTTEQDLVAGSVTATLDGGALPPELTLVVDDGANNWRVDFDDPYAVPAGPDQQLVVEFDAIVTDVASNTRNTNTRNTATLTYENASGTSRSASDGVNTRIVEPNIEVTKTDDDVDGTVTSGQELLYTVQVENDDDPASVSVAHDVVVIDTVPDEVTVLDGPSGSPVGDGGTVGPDGGTWDEDDRTITWTVTSIAPGDAVEFDYAVTVVDPVVAGSTIRNDVVATTTSIAGADGGERTSSSPNGGTGSGYVDDAFDTLSSRPLVLTKTADPGTATVGETVTYTLVATIPADLVAYDTTIVDALPPGLTFDSLVSVDCDQGGSCTPDITFADVDVVPDAPFVDGGDIAFFLGDLTTPATADRVITLVYETFVSDVAAADSGATLTNGAVVGWNADDEIAGTPGTVPTPGSFDTLTPTAGDDVATVEPSLTIDKDVAGQVGDTDTRRAVAGDTLEYTITVTNDGNAPAYDVVVTDVPSDDTWAFTDTTAAAGVVNSDSDPDGGFEWTIAGPIATGDSVTISYELVVPTDFDSSDENVAGAEQVNTADIPSYFAAPKADRDAAEPGRTFRDYDDVDDDTVEIELDLASIGDTVWFDVDGDGTIDPGEPRLEDITVTVTYLGANGIVGGGDDEVFVTETDGFGNYLVEDLPGGVYTVDVDETDPDLLPGLAPSYDLDGGIGSPNGFWQGNLGEDQDRVDVDFGYTGTGSIGDQVFLDQNLDGTQNAGEGGLPGVDITVTWLGPDDVVGGGDDIVYTTTTDSNGEYVVDDLPAGEYVVTVDTDDLPADHVNVADPDGGSDSTASLTLGAGEDDEDQDFGYAGNGSIGDTIWLDQDGDGTQNGEPGLSGVDVQVVHYGPDGLLGTDDDSTFVVTTGTSGDYLLENLPYGEYDVTVLGSITALDNTGDPDTVGVGDSTSNTELTPGAPDDLDQDFGYRSPSLLGDTVWFDLDGDGTQDPGEPGLANIGITATGPFGVTLTTTTDANGNYSFTNIVDGEWTVTVDTDTLPPGLTATGDDDGVGTPDTSTTTLTGVDTDQDFGYAGPGRIGDTVWLDLDGDGTVNGDEVGLGGVTVTLTWAQPSGPAIELTTTTSSSGQYSFDNLPLGDYTVTVDTDTLPAGVAATYDDDGGGDSTSAVTLTAGDPEDLDQDFGYRGTGSIGDTVWFDRNGNGEIDGDETGLPGIDVTLTWDGPDGLVDFTTTTDADGVYSFDGLPPGDYTVTVDTDDLPTGMVPTFDADSGADSTSSLVLGDGETNDDQDFGYRGTGSIGDTVFLDLDGDGSQGPGEPGVPDQTVELTWDSPDGPVVYTTITDASGGYLFDGLPPADYDVTVVGGIADVALNTADPDGGDDATGALTLGLGEDNDVQDFGFRGENAIGDTVWYDVDGDGSDDGAELEPRLVGVDVAVVWFGPDGVEGTDDDIALPIATTNAAGMYLVPSLPDGSFSVTVVGGVPAGLDVVTYDGDGSTAALDGTSIVNELGVGIVDPVVDLDQDFGYTGTGRIGDTIWLDLDADGAEDDGEPGIPGAQVTITWAGPDGVLGNDDDHVYPTLTTDADGAYDLGGLPAGVFGVDVAGLPAGLTSTADPDGGADDTSTLTLAVGEENLEQDFGYVGDASIGDTVFVDADADGVEDPEESGVPGVPVTVTSPGADGVLGTDDDIVVETVTDADGTYLVVGLPTGPTEVSYDPTDLTDGLEPGSDLDGDDPTVTTVELESGDDVRDVDFGVIGDASIDGTVWVDTDGDGVRDPDEEGIPGVDVEVIWDGPDGTVTIVVTTDDDGDWSLPTVPPGDYDVIVDVSTVPADLIPTTPTTDDVIVPAGGNGSTSAGFVPPSSIGDLVWTDSDRDGVRDPSEPGVVGVTVTLIDEDGETVATTTTAADGTYLFPDLVPGRYVVVVDPTVIAESTVTYDLDGGTDGRTVVDLTADTDRRDVDFGLATLRLPSAGGGAGLMRPALVLVLAGVGLLMLTSWSRRRRPALG